MNFNKAVNKKNVFINESKLLESNFHKKIWESFKPQIESLYKELYYLYEVKTLYYAGNFLLENTIPDRLEIMFELNKEDFEDLVDSHLIENYNSGIKFYCNADKTYVFEDKWTTIGSIGSWSVCDSDINKIIIKEFE